MNNTYNIKIEDIENASGKTINVDFEDHIEGIKSKKPIIADLTINSLGEFIEIKGDIKGFATLECDLCLEEFEYELDIEVDETFAKKALQEEYKEEIEITEGQFITDLGGDDNIDIVDFLYQSVILDFPNKKVCGINCKGGDIFIRDEGSSSSDIDPRMAVFKNIELKKPNK